MVKSDLINKEFLGVVEHIDINGENINGKKKGRIKVRIEKLHGKKDEANSIPTSTIPWASPVLDGRGIAFITPTIGKIVRVIFLDGDYYKPVYTSTEHYNINLQEKIQSLSDSAYSDFYAVAYDDKHQYYHDIDTGVMFDYVKSHFNINPQGDMKLSLRDNNSKLYLGSPDASERIILGEKFLKMFDELAQNLIGAKGGPFIGNLMAPVMPNPALIEWANKYFSGRASDLYTSDHVYVVDDKQVKPQTRKFDKAQALDNYNEIYGQTKKAPETQGYQPEERPNTTIPPEKVPANALDKTFSNSTLPSNPTDKESLKTVNPTSSYKNGEFPIGSLTKSKWLVKSFGEESSTVDGKQRLLDEAATSLDLWLDEYDKSRNNFSQVIVTRGYTSLAIQQNNRQRFGPLTPQPGKDPFGFANQVEIYFGVDDKNMTTVNALKDYLRNNTVSDNISVKTLDLLIKIASKHKWRLTGRDGNNQPQWSQWIYDPNM